MKSIIQELQFEATKQGGSVTELLRKCKIVASKLDLQEFLVWISNELSGYTETDYNKIPNYRMIKGEPKGWNPYHGWVPVIFGNTNSQEVLSHMPINQAIGELEDLYNSESDNLHVPYSPKAQKKIGDAVGLQTKFALIVSKNNIVGILNAVRNIVLDWSIKLEKEGILGEGISFSEKDVKKAHEPSTVIKVGRIDNFVGNVGNVTDNASVNISNVTQGEIAKIKDLVKSIRQNVANIPVKEEEQKKINKELGFIDAEVIKEVPKRDLINKSLSSIKRICEGASSSIIAQGILYGIAKILTNGNI